MFLNAIGERAGVIIIAVLLFGLSCIAGAQPMPKGVTPLCSEFPVINAQLPELMAALGVDLEDFDEDGLPETAALALIRAVACFQENDRFPADILAAYEALSEAAFDAYEVNLVEVDSELDAAELAEFREVIAVLMFIGAATQETLSAALSDYGAPLTGVYELVTCDATDSCLPKALPGRQEYLVLANATKAPNEPYSGTGDPDEDLFTNAEEFTNIGLGPVVFAASAMDPDVGGPIPSVTDVSGGGGCFIATAAYGTPMAGEVDTLRAVRDRFLLQTPAGAAFVDTYYRVSPPIAEVVAENGALRAIVRTALTPVVLVSNASLWSPSCTAITALALCGLAGAAGSRMRRRT